MELATRRPTSAAMRLEASHAGGRLQVEHGAHVHAAGRGVAGERSAHAVGRDDALKLVDEVGEALRRHRRVLDERGGALDARRAHEQGQRRAAQLPGLVRPRRGRRRRSSTSAPRSGVTARRRSRPARPSSRLPWYSTSSTAGSVPSRIGARRVKRRRLGEPRSGTRSISSTADGPVVEDREVGLQRGAHAGEREGGQRPRRGTLVELHLDLGEQRERAFGAGQQAGEVGLGREQLGQVVARDAASRARKAGGEASAPRRDRRAPPRSARASRAPPPARRAPAAQVVARGRARRRAGSPPASTPRTRSSLSLVSP